MNYIMGHWDSDEKKLRIETLHSFTQASQPTRQFLGILNLSHFIAKLRSISSQLDISPYHRGWMLKLEWIVFFLHCLNVRGR